MILVRSARHEDAPAWVELRTALWPEAPEDHPREVAAYFEGELPEPQEVLLAETDTGELVGLAELSIRAYAEGCETGRVAYLEGWYVVPGHRRRGVGRALVEAAEEWGSRQGCRELASDAEIGNTPSHAAHGAVGFETTADIRCFRKEIERT